MSVESDQASTNPDPDFIGPFPEEKHHCGKLLKILQRAYFPS